ncbi:MAG: Verru/Chthon cassette protein A, partial [Verrucomicrobiota bacterium]
QTILLRPQLDSPISAARNGGRHPGTEDPKDHYFLDFFWMPVVEPWSISSPLSTAGKVNINYDIQPFKHIHRSSGVRAVFASEEMLTVPAASASEYTAGSGYGRGYERGTNSGGSLRSKSLRSSINAYETLRQFSRKFDEENDLFVSASQICEMHLVPKGIHGLPLEPKLEEMENDPTMWTGKPRNPKYGFGLVGDNSRERPYSNIYQRITTKSNTFQVHYRSQVLRQSPMSVDNPGRRRTDDEYAVFDPDVDQVVSEYRGSTIVERYVDPNDNRIPDYASSTGGSTDQSLDSYYRFRILSMKRFAP